MKVFLANAPWSKPGLYGVRAGSRWPHFEDRCNSYMPFPFFLAYASALLKKNGIDTVLCDAIAAKISMEEFLRRLREASPDLIVYEVSTSSLKTDLDIARKTRGLIPQAKIAFAGAHQPMYERSFLEQCKDVDFVLIGEYELSLLALVRALTEGADLALVPGLLYRDGPAVKSTDRAPLETDLDSFPWPDRESLPMMNYWDCPGGIPAPSLQMWASRGCPFQCRFCVWPQIMYGGNRYRVRDPRDVVREIRWCVERWPFKSIYFDDDTFNIGKPRMLRLAEELKRNGPGLPWAMMARADTTDRETLAALKDAGLSALKYGVESGDQGMLDRMGKGLNLEKVREAVSYTRELDIPYHLTFTFGMPGETHQTAMKSIALAMELAPDTIQFSIATPYPGSKFHEEVKQKGQLLSENYDEYDGYHRAVVRTDDLTAVELEEILRLATRKWRRFEALQRVKREPVAAFRRAMRHPLRTLSLLFR